MTSQPVPIRIPLLEISGKVKREESAKELPQGLKRISELEINPTQGLPKQGYALEIPKIIGVSSNAGVSLGIFERGEGAVALDDIYALGLVGQEPLICKVVKSDAQPGSSDQEESSPTRAKNPRKSFMTPTPLHIPDSQVSPIPDSAHEMIYLKVLSESDALKVVPLQDVVWMHPLVSMMENPGE